ncbi:class II aldolase/adducin family protein [Pseudonocardia sp. GCM10023141]|uniref:class II aldolase/adducin family protein n=1 Tax=Pseudonocardia sp. GCM10023141 TaxID=3252653 RepID=UPI00360ED26C
MTSPAQSLVTAGAVLAGAGLVTAFGHVSVRLDGESMLITPPVPLASVDPDRCVPIDLDAAELPPGAPHEAWLHLAVYRARPHANAVCRAQPERVTALTAGGVAITPITGHAVLAGAPVPVSPDAVLVRDAVTAGRAATALGTGDALVLRGNGAITLGVDVGAAVARMWLLERAARSVAIAAATGDLTPLPDADAATWRLAAPELLQRIWTHLTEETP